MRFQYGNSLIEKFYDHLSVNYRGEPWGINGPLALSKVILDACHVNADNAERVDCFNVTGYDTKWFNPVDWNNSAWVFEEAMKNKVLEATNQSYTMHFANKMSSKMKLDMNLDTAYRALAHNNCPHSFEVLKKQI